MNDDADEITLQADSKVKIKSSIWLLSLIFKIKRTFFLNFFSSFEVE